MLNFKLFGFAVSVHATFLIVTLFVLDLGLDGTELALWTVAAFLSIMIHELGHAFTARAFGAQVQGIVLQWLGGATYWLPDGRSRRGWPRFAISAAGSGVQALLGLAIWGAISLGWLGRLLNATMQHPIDPNVFAIGVYTQEYAPFFVGAFVWVSIVWALFNYLPVGGFDGSHMLREVLEMRFPDTAWLHSLMIGLATAVVVSIVLFNMGFDFAPILLLAFAGMDLVRVLQSRRR